MIDIDTYNDEPNFSVIVPSKCEMRCSFCSNPGVGDDGNPPEAWMEKLGKIIWQLPPKFRSVSITGGEPTTWSSFDPLMFMLRKRFAKVVVSTNGVKLGAMGFALRWANDVNLSWHGIGVVEASKAFGVGVDHPDSNAIQYLRKNGTGVTLVWVITPDTEFDGARALQYAELGRMWGCSAVAFRYDMHQSDGLEGNWIPALGPSVTLVSDDECPVCRTWRYDRRGFPMLFKASVVEPHDALDSAYELIYTADGVLSTTWDGSHPVGYGEDEMKESDSARLDRIEEMLMRLLGVEGEQIHPKARKEPRVHHVRHESSGGGGSCYGSGGHC
jgi:hypothetical protein